MQAKFTFKKLKVLFSNTLLLLFLLGFISQKISAQTYVNGNLSTGATAADGTAAPAGYTWSEVQSDAGNTTETNANFGFGANIAAFTSVADDFTVPAGDTWNISKFTFYAYSTGYTGATSPFNKLRVLIHSSSPLAGPTTIIFGDTITNRLTSSTSAQIYRTANTLVPTATPPGTTRKIWKLEANVVTTLTAGTYWVEWQCDLSTGTSNFSPPSTVVGARTQPGYNAIQKTAASAGVYSWAALADGGNPATAPDAAMDMPFSIDYTTNSTTAPSCATGLTPANNATGIALNGAITWTAAAGATSYDVYFGTSATPPLVTNVTGTSYTISPPLTLSTQYFYKIVAKNAIGDAVGCVTNTFTTTSVNACQPPGIPVINPVSSICLNSITPLEINPVATSLSSVVVNSATLSILVPDNVATGASTTLVVPALPAGAVVTGIDVKLNMVHTYPGDMIFNLKAPNGQILNLYKYANGAFTGPDGSLVGAGWFNAITSSAGTVDYGTIGSPYAYGSTATPGPFAADALNAPVTGPTVQNPNGFAANAANFAALYSVPAGTWTLAMADGGPGDLGTLTGWSIIIKYSISTTAFPAVWSPASSLTTDAAGAVPYDGITPLFKVYAKPTVTTTYSAISQDGTCVSPGAATVTVTVNVPAKIDTTRQPVSAAICEFGSTSFNTKATGTTPSYQWQVNTGSGIYTALSNDANYSGATADTLKITGAPYSWNGYKYRCFVTSAAPCTQKDSTRNVILTVNPTPVVSLSAAPYTRLLPGLNSTITVSSAPAANTYTWYKNGLPLPLVTSASFPITVDDLGSYKVTVIDVNGCTNTSDEFVISDTVSSRLFIYPNPAPGGRFQVRYYSITGNVLPRILLVYDAKGALVMNKTFTIAKPYDAMDVNFNTMGKGVYFIDLLTATGKRLATGKVLVQ